MHAPKLAGIRVVEIGQYIPSPYAGLMLSDLGADVVKIEPPHGDPMRRTGKLSNEGVSASYHAMNRGKRVLSIDLKSPDAQEQVRGLIGKADVLIESFRPGVLDRLGLSQGNLKNINPRLVHCAISGFGQTGPLRMEPGHDVNYMAAGGGLGLSGIAERPVITRPPISDYSSAMQAALTILAALLARERTGQGCFIDIAMADVVLAWQAPSLSESLHDPTMGRGTDADTGGIASYNIYRTREGRHVSLGAEEPHFWSRFCKKVSRPDWIDRALDPAPQRGLIADVAELFASEDAGHWRALLEGADCCFQLVLDPSEVLAFPQFVHRGLLRQASWGGVDVLYPAWIDGNPPHAREAFVDCAPEDLAAIWRTG